MYFQTVIIFGVLSAVLAGGCVKEPTNPSVCYYYDFQDSYGLYTHLNDYAIPSGIKKIYFRNSQLTHLPKELTVKYTSLDELDLSNIQLWRFVKIDFATETSFRVLNVSHNKIHRVETDVCKGMKNLEVLDLSYNVIDRIDFNAFYHREGFKYLNLSHNRIGKLTNDFFDSIRSVRVLHLDNNKISSISGDFSQIKMQLEELYLGNNEITAIEPELITSVTYLDISNNIEWRSGL